MSDVVKHRGDSLWLWCPGCKDPHRVTVSGDGPVQWQWDGNTESPTINPSILVRYDVSPPNQHMSTVCHSFVRGGVWDFLGDCTHALAGQQVPMGEVEWPDWLLSEKES